MDIVLSAIAILLLSPVMLLIAVLVRTKLGSPVIFCQERPGKDEKIFKMYKFRSMTDARDENGELLPDEVRLTKFGRALRSTALTSCRNCGTSSRAICPSSAPGPCWCGM